MDFKTFYVEQEQLNAEEKRIQEFSKKLDEAGEFGSGIAALGQAAGKLTGGALNLAGKAIGGVAKPVAKAVGGVASRLVSGLNVDNFKAKITNIIDLAEKVYPFDKKIYDDFRKEQDKSSTIAKYMGILANPKVSFGQVWAGYSAGIDIVMRTFDIVSKNVQVELEKVGKKGKTSVQSLGEATEYRKVGQVRFKKMNSAKEVSTFFETDSKNDTSTLSKWIETSTYFSTWKNKYDGHDDENVTKNIVSDLLEAGILNNLSTKVIDDAMKEMEKDGIQITAENIKEKIDIPARDLIDYITAHFDAQVSKIGLTSTDIYPDEESKKSLAADAQDFIIELKKNNPKAIIRVPEFITNLFIAFKYLAKISGRSAEIGILTKQSYFADLFKNFNKKEKGKQFNAQDSNTMLTSFVSLVKGNLVRNNNKVALTKELLSDKQKLLDVLLPTQTEAPTVK